MHVLGNVARVEVVRDLTRRRAEPAARRREMSAIGDGRDLRNRNVPLGRAKVILLRRHRP